MKRKKGKRKVYLFTLRNNRKKFRNGLCRKKGATTIRNKASYRETEDNFLGNDYNKVISHLNNKNFKLPKLRLNSHACERIKIPEEFSISENAEQVIYILRRVYTVAINPQIDKIIFDHSECVNLGLSASTMMDIIILAVEKYRERNMHPLELEGELPYDAQVRDILLASGLPYHLGAESMVEFDKDHVERFETIMGVHDLYANKSDETATKLTNYFNKCLKTQSMELNDEGKRLLSRILGEVISNCEIHGGDAATWYTQGHYQIRRDKFGEMQLLFLTIGNTIYEGLKSTSSNETKEKLLYILNAHHKYLSRQWDEEMIYTVFALQEGISRLRDKSIEGYESRGSGTVSMIEMFNDIGESETGLKPRMTIISGRTQIKFGENYKMKSVSFCNDRVFETGDKKIIAFNKENNIYYPADPENVKKISQYFPGTIISLKFYLDSRYIVKRKKKG